MTGIIDYGAGNLASVANALHTLGIDSSVCSSPDQLMACSHAILPGVGSFRVAMEFLHEKKWVTSIHEFIASGKPFLGICLGMQLLFESGDEDGPTPGLALIDGHVVHLNRVTANRTPHVGWNSLTHKRDDALMVGIKKEVDYYFVHSFHCVPSQDEWVVATCDYGGEFVAVVRKQNIVGLQFHPEKSQPSGMKMLENFSKITTSC